MNELLFVVAIVTMIQGGKPVGTATGFVYLRNDVLYFVTNRHVVRDEAKGLKPDALRVRLHVDANDLTKSLERDIPLYENGQARVARPSELRKEPDRRGRCSNRSKGLSLLGPT